MADNERGIGLPQDQKDRLASAMGAAVVDFLALDTELTKNLVRITGSLADFIQQNPRIFESGLDPKDLEGILNELRSRGAGGDVSGGAGITLQDLADFIKQISGFIDSEKQFFLQIIKLIFCGC
jgi:hypothetical protein